MQPDTQLGHYRITGKLGVGGMGEVYGAEDSRLRRNVAIKVLPAELANDPERLARLEREAQVLASLEHPNIAAIYGLEEVDGVRFLVMQLAQGDTLEARIAQGPIPAAEVLLIAVQIARGLEAAHEKGVIHRDLKPANVMLDDDGNVKLLDFGLAKPTEADQHSTQLTASPTMLEATQAGVIMGTAAYMSPEQARGRAVDKRTDIWAWGCVAYEMLTGQRLFNGDSISDIIAALLRQDIEFDGLPADTPANLRSLIGRTLVREPADRLRDIGDARIALMQDDDVGVPATAAPRRSPVPVAIGALVAGAVLGALGLALASRSEPAAIRQLDLVPPGLQTGTLVAPSISPDGNKVLYRANDRLWVRDLSQPTGRIVGDATGVQLPFWGADSGTVVFVADEKLWRQSLSGGAAVELASFPDPASGGGGAWDPAGRLLVAQGSTEILSMPARGGELTPLLSPDASRDEGHFHAPTVLPDGTILYVLHRVAQTADAIGASRDGERQQLLELPGDYLEGIRYSPEGALLFARSGNGGDGIWLVPFDPVALEVTGPPVMLLPGAGAPSLSADGKTLLYDPRGGLATDERGAVSLVGDLTSGSGEDRDTVEALTEFENLVLDAEGQRISHDGSRLVFSVRAEGGSDLWLVDLERGTRRQLTDDEAGFEIQPVWSSDDEWIYFSRNDTTIGRIRSDGSGEIEDIGPGRMPTVVHGTDRLLVRRRGEGIGAGEEIWFLDAEPGGATEPFKAGRNAYRSSDVSHDGEFVAFASHETGDWEVVVEGLRGEGRWAVSTGGGRSPRWAADGDLYYIAPPATVTKVSVSRDDAGIASFSAPEAVLELTPAFTNNDVMPVQTPRGLRFLTVEIENGSGGHLVVVLNADQLIREALGR